MVKLFRAFAFLLMCQQEACTDLRFDYFKMVEEMVEERADILWSVGNVSSTLKCATLCLAERRCSTLGFVEAKGTCQAFRPGARKSMGKNGFTAYFSRERSASIHGVCDNDKDCYGNGSLCFRGNCMCDPELTYNTSKEACVRKPGGMYQPCVTNDQCHINGSVCLKGRCMCTPGLSYDKAEQACVRRCSKYGKTMSIYEGLSITDHNEIAERNVSVEQCTERCTATTDFLCLTVEMQPVATYCYSSTYGYLDVSESDRLTGQAGWLFGTRDCAFD